MTRSSGGCQGGSGFCGWQAGHGSCLGDTLTHGRGRASGMRRMPAVGQAPGQAPGHGLVIPALGLLALGVQSQV